MNKISEIAQSIDNDYKRQIDSIKTQADKDTQEILHSYKHSLQNANNTIFKDTQEVTKTIQHNFESIQEATIRKVVTINLWTILAGIIVGVTVTIITVLAIVAMYYTNQVQTLHEETTQLEHNLQTMSQNWKLKNLQIQTGNNKEIYLSLPKKKGEIYESYNGKLVMKIN